MHPLETQIQELLDEIGTRPRGRRQMETLRAKLMAIKDNVRDMEVTLRRYDDMLEMSACQRY